MYFECRISSQNVFRARLVNAHAGSDRLCQRRSVQRRAERIGVSPNIYYNIHIICGDRLVSMAWNCVVQRPLCEAIGLIMAKNKAKKGDYRAKNLSQKRCLWQRFPLSACRQWACRLAQLTADSVRGRENRSDARWPAGARSCATP